MSETYKEISADLADFVSKMTQSIAQAQQALDLGSIEMLKTLADETTKVPQITNTIEEIKDSDGKVIDTTSSTKTTFNEMSLLNLGIRPTFYQFSKTLIEVSLDMQIEEQVTTNTQNKKYRILVGTKKVRQERRYNRNITAYSKLSVEMVPVPMPSYLPELITNKTE
ncbi:hypothetical protein MNBD_GAMMA04-706 [hydrothermal vent metagenome]|uniref:Uncharacterized protein n=1 Tax=hydrothermal vent metagenome TaxID=652676 RepID=A0A3B0VZ50_9ZZZZ